MDINFKINAADVLEAMSGGGSLSLRAEAKRAAKRAEEIITPRHLAEEHLLTVDGANVRLEGMDITVVSKDLAAHLSGCHACLLLLFTLGADIDRETDKLSLKSMLSALALDAAAGCALQSYTGGALRALAAAKAASGDYLTQPFGAGCGDFDVSYLRPLLLALNAQKFAGVTLSGSLVMSPKKTLLLLAGITDKPTDAHGGGKCPHCKGSCGKCGKDG